jgi:hypothetical protein
MENYNNKKPAERSAGNLIKLSDAFLLFGGGNRKETFKDTWLLKITNEKEYTWNEISLNRYIEPRFGSAAAYLGDNIYIHGGQNYNEGRFYGDLHQIALKDSKLNYVKNHTIYPINKEQTPVERNSHSICDNGADLFYIFGGGNSTGLLDDLWTFDTTANRWAKHEVLGKTIAAREMHGMVYYRDLSLDKSYIFIFGGRRYESFDDYIYRIDVSNNGFNCDYVKKLPFALSSFAYCLYDHYIIIYGGTDGNKFMNNIIIYNINNGKWAQSKFQPLTEVNELGGRISSMMAIDHEKGYLIIFGGTFIIRDTNDIQILNLNELLDSNNLIPI